ncbi:DUF4358 domain-containing protein [Paenibacillus sp. NPDC058174]|uniref:DUF4358 domain-containing protein n=1 Tax=Paenibacillus sp. NPDC058174 TaxID=3346366 RepID=UPI0036DF3AEC
MASFKSFCVTLLSLSIAVTASGCGGVNGNNSQNTESTPPAITASPETTEPPASTDNTHTSEPSNNAESEAATAPTPEPEATADPTSKPTEQSEATPKATQKPVASEQPQASNKPSATPKPTPTPISNPSATPSLAPSDKPTVKPSAQPSEKPSAKPSPKPSEKPADQITAADIAAKIKEEVQFGSLVAIEGDQIKEFYGIDAGEQLEEGKFYQAMIMIQASEFSIVKLKSDSDYKAVAAGFDKRAEMIQKAFENYLQDQYELAKNYQVIRSGDYVLFSVSLEQDKIKEAFQSFFAKK